MQVLINCRTFVLVLVLCFSTTLSATKSRQSTILVLGDSLSAGYGIPLNKAWVQLLQDKLTNDGFNYQVVNAAISGDTSKNALTRLPELLKIHNPNIVIVEIGGNDGLRGQPIKSLRHNIAAIIKLSQSSSADILLAGIQIPANFGPVYTRRFKQLYSELAKQYRVALVPHFMENVANNAALMQEDGIHANEQAQAVLLANTWPHLLPLLKAVKTKHPAQN